MPGRKEEKKNELTVKPIQQRWIPMVQLGKSSSINCC
jgi:hypothetical protein